MIAVLQEEYWIERGNALGEYFLNGLKQLQSKSAAVKDARGRGMMFGLELDPAKMTVSQVYRSLLEKGFLVGYYPAGNLLRFDPSLTIEKEDLSRALECLRSILA